MKGPEIHEAQCIRCDRFYSFYGLFHPEDPRKCFCSVSCFEHWVTKHQVLTFSDYEDKKRILRIMEDEELMR
jgi:hypothetical protein